MKTSIIALSLFSVFLTQVTLAEDQCTVLGYHESNTQIYDGPTWCDHVHIKNISVRGPFDAKMSYFSGNSDVSGPLESNDSKFQSITEDEFSPEKITLTHTSQVKGNIVFKGDPGEVILSKTSSVKGKVINGKIIRQ